MIPELPSPGRSQFNVLISYRGAAGLLGPNVWLGRPVCSGL